MAATQQTQLRLSPELHLWAKEEALRRRISLNVLIVELLERERNAVSMRASAERGGS